MQQQPVASRGVHQQSRVPPLGGGNIAMRTKGDGQEMPATHEDFADTPRPWQGSAKPSRRGSNTDSAPMGNSTSTHQHQLQQPQQQLTSVDNVDARSVLSTAYSGPTAERPLHQHQQIPSHGGHMPVMARSPQTHHQHHSGNRRRVTSLPLRSLNSPPSTEPPPLSPPYAKGVDGASMPPGGDMYQPYHASHHGTNNGYNDDALLQKIQQSSRRRRQPYAPSFASRTPATEGGNSSVASSRTSSMSDLSTSYPTENIYQSAPRHFPAHPASGFPTHSHSQPSSGHHTPSKPLQNGLLPSPLQPTYGGQSPLNGLSPNRPRSERSQQQGHIAPANIHTVHPAATVQSENLYATTTALLHSTNAGSRSGVILSESGSNSNSPSSGHREQRHANHDHQLHRHSSSDSMNARQLSRGTSNDSIGSLERLPEDCFVPTTTSVTAINGTPGESTTLPMTHTISSGSIDSSGSSGIGHSTSPSLERSVRLGSSNNMAPISESRAISRSSSGSSLSASSCTSLDAGGNGPKRVVFGPSSDRKKIKLNKEPPSIQEAKQAALKSLTVGQAMEAATSGNLAHLHRLQATALQANEQLSMLRDANGVSPLHKAAECGHIDIVNFLLKDCGLSEEGRRKATAMADKDYLTPCMLAVQNGHLDCVKVLVEASQGDFETDDHGSTLLHLAAAFDQADCLEYIVDAMKRRDVDPHVATDTGVTPAHVAAQKGSINCLRILFDAGTQMQADDEDLTPIDWAHKAGHGLCEHYLTVIQTCWALHVSLEEAETKLTKSNKQNRSLETQLTDARKQQAAVEDEIQKVKEECDRRLKETKEDFAQLMTRMMEQVGGGKSALREKMEMMNASTLFPTTSPTSTVKKSKSASPPVPPRTVTLPNSNGSSPASSKSNGSWRNRSDLAEGVRKRLEMSQSLDSAEIDEVMSVVEREQQLDSLNMSNIGISDVEDEDENCLQ
eukprot:scpid4467/ scgid31902/ Ankyrin repeat, PH and SEC7 domain containing protein secG